MTRALPSLLALSLLGGCMATQSTADLEAVGVRRVAEVAGWHRFASRDFRFELPGVPDVEPVRYDVEGHPVSELRLRLFTERHSRLFDLRIYDLRALDPMQQETLRRRAEARRARIGDRTQARRGMSDGQYYYEVLVENIGRNGHLGILRTELRDGFLFTMMVITAPGSGGPTDATHFFESVRRTAR